MNISRRSFLGAGSKVGLAAIFSSRICSLAVGQQKPSQQLGTGIGAPIPREVFSDPLYYITRAMFAENLRTKFTFSLGGVKLTDVTLIEVNDLNPPFIKGNGTTSRECFSVVFQGPRSLPLRQNTYTIEHARLGKFQLLVVPGDPGKGSLHYGADINRVYP